MAGLPVIKVLVPDCPTADEILPYLREIDANRWYANSGPLVKRLEARMGGVSVSSATAGLELASQHVFKRRKVRIPAFTFVATATALLRAGFDPVLCDVDNSWALKNPDEDSLSVCPFGAPVAPGGLVDAAAAWGNQTEGARVFSLHATKALPAGEGGIVCGDDALIESVRDRANFGLKATPFSPGIVNVAGTNAKLSEYHAAVALASLDRWVASYKWRSELDKSYRYRLAGFQTQIRPFGAYTTMPVLVKDAATVAKRMFSRGIETRRWYTPTLERHPAFSGLKVEGPLTKCAQLNDQVLCLPFHKQVTTSEVDQICETLKWAVKNGATTQTFLPPITQTASRCTENQPRT